MKLGPEIHGMRFMTIYDPQVKRLVNGMVQMAMGASFFSPEEAVIRVAGS